MHEILVGVERFLALRRDNALRPAVRQKTPALLVVLEVGHHELVDNLLVHGRIGDRNEHLDPAVEIARHPVGRRDVDLGRGRRKFMPGTDTHDS
jgi:hypothetical protein